MSKTVKQEIRDNFLRMLQAGEDLFPGIIGYENTVIPEINLALIAGHDMLFLGEKGQAKSRLMRSLVRFLDDAIPYLDHPVAVRSTKIRIARSPRPANACSPRRPRTEVPHRLVAARAALRRTPGPGHQVRRRHRRDRPGQAGRRHQHGHRGGAALRPDPAHAPRHLRHERDARTGRTGAGRPVQHPRRARRADSRLSRSSSTSTC